MKNPSKQPIVFLPGWGFKASIWADIAYSFPEHETILLDLPVMNEASEAHHINHYLHDNIPDHAVIVAWSLGGLLAIQFCAEYKEKCCKLVLVATLPRFVEAVGWLGISVMTSKKLQKSVLMNINALLARFVNWVRFPDLTDARLSLIVNHLLPLPHYAVSIQYYLSILLISDLREHFISLNTRLFMLLGEKDDIVPVAATEHIKKLRQDIAITVIPEAGHALFITHQQQFIESLKGIVYA